MTSARKAIAAASKAGRSADIADVEANARRCRDRRRREIPAEIWVAIDEARRLLAERRFPDDPVGALAASVGAREIAQIAATIQLAAPLVAHAFSRCDIAAADAAAAMFDLGRDIGRLEGLARCAAGARATGRNAAVRHPEIDGAEIIRRVRSKIGTRTRRGKLVSATEALDILCDTGSSDPDRLPISKGTAYARLRAAGLRLSDAK